MKKIALIAFFAVTTANAGTPVKSEYFYQTDATQHQVTPELTYISDKTEFTGASSETTNQTLNVRYEYGINEMLSTGAQIGYLTGETETAGTAADQTGMTDITLFVKGQNSWVDSQSFHYGANFGWSPGDATVDTTGETNAMTGGMSLTPYAGYLWMVGKGVAGVNLSTQVDIGDRTIDDEANTDKTKATGGNDTTLTGLYEHPMEWGLVGTSLSYIATNTTENETGAVTSETTGGNFWRLRVYPTYKVSETATVIGQIAYQGFLGDSVTSGGTVVDVDSSNVLTLQVGGRFTF